MKTYSLDPAEAASNTRIRRVIADDSPFMLKILGGGWDVEQSSRETAMNSSSDPKR